MEETLAGGVWHSKLLAMGAAARQAPQDNRSSQVGNMNTNMDDVNLVTCQLARHRFGVARIISLISNPDHYRLFQLAGIDVVINTSQLIMDAIGGELNAIMTGMSGDIE